jgi:hypothetical protein
MTIEGDFCPRCRIPMTRVHRSSGAETKVVRIKKGPRSLPKRKRWPHRHRKQPSSVEKPEPLFVYEHWDVCAQCGHLQVIADARVPAEIIAIPRLTEAKTDHPPPSSSSSAGCQRWHSARQQTEEKR